MPGTTYAPPIAAMDPTWLEGDDTRKKRQAAQRLLEALDAKAAGTGAKFMGRKPGGGLTNKEKRRFKNFGMLRKSFDVQAKVRRTLASTQKALRARRTGLKVTDTRKKQRRRRA